MAWATTSGGVTVALEMPADIRTLAAYVKITGDP